MRHFKVNLPFRKKGSAQIKRLVVSKAAAKWERVRAVIHNSDRFVPAGKYTALYINGEIVMSDTPNEIEDHLSAIARARGNVLINGLGLGMVLQAIARRKEVKHVTVVEINQDVIDLVWPHYKKKFGKKIECICCDALQFVPTQKYDYVWHDIWNTINADNLPEMAKLHRKYARKTNGQGSWAKKECQRLR